jgi:hypothetical protein
MLYSTRALTVDVLPRGSIGAQDVQYET